MAAGGMGLILLLGLLSGGGSLDIVSTLPAKEYFKARDIDVTAERLMELATQNPDTAKKQIGQLMALSHLSSDIDLIKKSPKAADYRAVLGDIANGKKANDATGFAADYAKRVLLALDGAKPPPPAKRSWKDGVKTLPEQATIVGFVDLTDAAGSRKFPDLAKLFDMMPKESKQEFWTAIERIGNLRVDSVGLAFTETKEGPHELVARFVGKGNPEWLRAAIENYKDVEIDSSWTAPAGQKLRVLAGPGTEPALVLIGDSEVLVGGYPPEFSRGKEGLKQTEVLKRLLVARANGNGALDGVLKADLAKIPADAGGAFVGNVPMAMRNEGLPTPVKILAHARRAPGGIDFVANGMMENEEAAKNLVMMVANGRDMALKQLALLQGQPLPVDGINIASIIALLESVQLQTNGIDTQIRVLVPDDTMSMLPMAFILPFQARAAAPPPVKKEVEKK